MPVMTDGPRDSDTPFRYHLELTPAQLKLTHTALRSLLDDFGHDEEDIRGIVQEVLAKLPDEHAIRAIQLDREPVSQEGAATTLVEVPTPIDDKGGDEGPPPPISAA